MIPVTDAVQARRFPFVNIALILACIAVFVYELTLSVPELDAFFRDYGAVPSDLRAWWDNPDGWGEPATVITHAFLHGGWLHLAGNMLFLWVFGDNVEDALGHIPYIVFYAVCGTGAFALQFAVDTDSAIPMVGASGAIAGVLGAYLLLYPRATVGVVVPLLWFLGAWPVPAFVLIVFWFVLQLFTGIATIGTDTESTGGGVAVWAHVGGFLTGFVIVFLLQRLLPRYLPKRSYTRSRRRRELW